MLTMQQAILGVLDKIATESGAALIIPPEMRDKGAFLVIHAQTFEPLFSMFMDFKPFEAIVLVYAPGFEPIQADPETNAETGVIKASRISYLQKSRSVRNFQVWFKQYLVKVMADVQQEIDRKRLDKQVAGQAKPDNS